jgi:hypothetical protein
MGYDTNHFTGLWNQLIEELKRGIYLEILRKPVATHCCLQVFCEDCIKSWLRIKFLFKRNIEKSIDFR